MVLVSCGGEQHDKLRAKEFSIEGQSEDGFEDGTYCANVTYDNPNTGTTSDYSLSIEVVNNEVVQINFDNGGWMDEDHFNAEDIDEDGICTFTSDKGYEYTVQITGQDC